MLSILIMLLGKRPRATFPFAEVVKNVQASVKSPLSRNEIGQCMKVLERKKSRNVEVIRASVGTTESWTIVRGGVVDELTN